MSVGIEGQQLTLQAESIGESENCRIIEFSWDNNSISFSTVLDAAGKIPIPPYLNRESEADDLTHYQTVYSKVKGSVAAPTAGLHFSDAIFQSLFDKGIQTEELTLHVGAGTFQPVKSETIDEHRMHSEQIVVPRSVIEKLLHHHGPVIAVGTTSVRSLESLYWLGCKLIDDQNALSVLARVEQWEPYDEKPYVEKKNALQALLSHMDRHGLAQIKASTQIIIVPGYRFRMVEGMFTNFHQPLSTLLLLVSAFIGNDWKAVYQHALVNNYRFLSYGDSNLYLK
jgi:S-adenosylmethionine:tRNA ribosyltransferase-isomerase